MAHQLTINKHGKAEMAYVGATPWHGLGQVLDADSTIDQWKVAAGLDWSIRRSPVHYQNGTLHSWDEHRVLYRSDNNKPLSVVSHKYKVVQPGEILEFFRDLVADDGFQLETAGSLYEGRRLWALARTGLGGEVVPNDLVKAYLLLVTSCDGGLATQAYFTSVRVVCNNTLQLSLSKDGRAQSRVQVRHNSVFDPRDVKGKLGLNARHEFDGFMDRMSDLANTSISTRQAHEVLETLFAKSGGQKEVQESRGFKTVMNLFTGDGKGAGMEGVAGTAWGLLNAVTEYTDFHVRARSANNRLNSAWFGPGAKAKSEVIALLEQL